MKVGFYVPGSEHLSVEALSAVLTRAGHTTEVFFDPRIATEGVFARPRFQRWFSVEDLVVEEILNGGLDVLCFSVVTDNFVTALRVAAKVKQHSDVPIVFGGVHCTSVPERVIQHPQVDYLVVGEGDDAIVELCEVLANGDRPTGVRNVWQQDGAGAVVAAPMRPVVPDLDALPFLDKDVFFAKVPRFFQKRYIALGSRGCPNSCTFCNNSMYKALYDHAGLGTWRRRRSVSHLVKELAQAHDKYEYDDVYFFDEIFMDDQEWLEAFCDQYGRAIGKPFFCHGHVRYITKDVIAMLEKAGCREINIGVQTIRECTRRDYLRRGGRNRDLAQAIKILSESRIFLAAGNILKLPGQSLEECVEIAEFYNENRVDLPIVSYLRYYPRTEIVDIACREGLLNDDDVDRIEDAEEEGSMYYLGGPNAADTDRRKIRLLILMTAWAPKSVIRLLVRNGKWRLLPAGGVLNLALSWMGSLRFLWTGKRTMPESSVTFLRSIGMLISYGVRKVRWERRRAT